MVAPNSMQSSATLGSWSLKSDPETWLASCCRLALDFSLISQQYELAFYTCELFSLHLSWFHVLYSVSLWAVDFIKLGLRSYHLLLIRFIQLSSNVFNLKGLNSSVCGKVLCLD